MSRQTQDAYDYARATLGEFLEGDELGDALDAVMGTKGVTDMDYFALGTTPSDEECVRVSEHDNYPPKMMGEAQRYMEMLAEKFADFLEGDMHFSIKMFPHDFGRYYDVLINYDRGNAVEEALAIHIEGNLPRKWTETGKPDLAERDAVLAEVAEETEWEETESEEGE